MTHTNVRPSDCILCRLEATDHRQHGSHPPIDGMEWLRHRPIFRDLAPAHLAALLAETRHTGIPVEAWWSASGCRLCSADRPTADADVADHLERHCADGLLHRRGSGYVRTSTPRPRTERSGLQRVRATAPRRPGHERGAPDPPHRRPGRRPDRGTRLEESDPTGYR